MDNSLKSLKKFGKSFYWAGMILPDYYLKRSADLYYLCRKLDDIADENRSKKTLSKLNLIKDLIIQGNYDKLKKIGIRVPTFLQNKLYARKAILDLLDGLIFDQGNVRIKNIEELLTYCYRVAGTVGVMMCVSLDCNEKKALQFAVDLGIGMQLTNIIRDVLEDAQLNRRYLPSSMNCNFIPSKIISISLKKKINNHEDKLIRNSLSNLLLISEEYYKRGKQGL